MFSPSVSHSSCSTWTTIRVVAANAAIVTVVVGVLALLYQQGIGGSLLKGIGELSTYQAIGCVGGGIFILSASLVLPTFFNYLKKNKSD